MAINRIKYVDVDSGTEGFVKFENLGDITASILITENGVYFAPSDIAGYKKITVDVHTVNNQDITITENGVYQAEEGYTGLGTVTVEVPEPTFETLYATENGTYIPTADGYSSVEVDVQPLLQDIRVTQNGEYTAGVGYYGLGKVTVDVSDIPAVIEPLSITATTSPQTISAPVGLDGYNPISVAAVTAAIDSNIQPENIIYGVDILGVAGSAVVSNETTLNVTPTTSSQTITPDGQYTGFNEVNVSAVDSSIDADIKPQNILSGINILGVNGSVVELKGDILAVNPTTSLQTFTPTGGHNGYTEVTVTGVDSTIDSNIKAENIKSGVSILGVNGSATILNGETVSITPTTSQQVITPTSPHNGITSATVSAVTSAIDSNISAENIKSGVSILGVNGSVIELNADSLSVTPTTSAQLIQPTSPYNAFDEVSVAAVTAAIDPNIVAGNIKSGVSILGVSGSVVEVKNQNKTINQNGTYTADAGYTGLGEVTVSVSASVLAGVNITATTSPITLTPPSGIDGWNQINVSAVTSDIDGNIIPDNIKDGETILGVTGNLVPLRAEIGAANPDTTSVTFTPTSPYNAFSSFTVNAVTAAIDSNIVAGNIKSGVSILGVVGNYSGGGSSGPCIEKTINQNGELIGGGTFIDLTGVTTIKRCGLSGAYMYSTTLSTADFSPVQTLAHEACYFTFAESTVTTIDMSTVTTLEEMAIIAMCVNNTSLTSVNLNGVNVIQGTQGSQWGTGLNPFEGCTHLEHVYLGGLTASTFAQSNNRLNYLFGLTTGSQAPNGCTVHFPSNFDPNNPDKTYDASTLEGYPSFGGSSGYIHIAFDLPASE